METKTENGVTTWSLDPTHSSIHFGVRHMVISEVKGSFESYKLKIEPKGASFEDATIEMEIDVNSINTNMVDRDNHLRGEDFFNAAKYPTIKFISTSFKKVNDEEYSLKGNITVKDVTKPIEFKVNYGGQVVDPWGNLRAGFSIEGSLDRFDFGLHWNALLETGGAVVSKKIKLEAAIEIVAAK